MLAGQIARALAVFCVDEIVIFDDGQGPPDNSRTHDDSYTGYSSPNHFMMHILSYLETPPNLRKPLFPEHGNLSLAGTLPSLDMPHHFRAHEWCQYRDGVTIEIIHSKDDQHEKSDNLKSKKKKQKSKSSTRTTTTMVNAGLLHPVSVAASIPPYTRVTLKFPDSVGEPDMSNADLTAAAIAPSVPREEGGYYWGYSVRPASSLSTVLTECPFDGGYDVTFGTSERGTPISLLNDPGSNPSPIPEFCHMLIVFGGVAGLEAAVKADAELSSMGVSKPDDLFDYWVNLCPGQGSRTIRTEEAVWLGLMGLRDTVLKRGKR